MAGTASCCTACAAGLAGGGASCETSRSGPAGAAEASGVALEPGVSPAAELLPAAPALEGASGLPALVPAMQGRALRAPVRLAPRPLRQPGPTNVEGPTRPAERAPIPREAAPAPPSPHLASGIALTLEEAQRLASSPQTSAGIAMTKDDTLALARHPASRAGLPPEPGTAIVRPPADNVALTLEHAQVLTRAPQFSSGIALTAEHAQALVESPTARAGIAMTLDESLALAEATQKHAAIALTMDNALAFARSPAARLGLELYDYISPDQMTEQRLSPEAVQAALEGGHPVFPLKGGGPASPGPQGAQFGPAVPKTLPGLSVQTPLWFYNALWTEYASPSAWGDFVDVGAGGGMVWAVTSDGQLWRLVSGNQTFEADLSMRAAARVAVLSDGWPVVVTKYGSVEELQNTPYHWKTLWAYAVNVVPGTSFTTVAEDVAAGSTGLLRDLVLAVLGGQVVDLADHHVVPVEHNAGIRAVAVAGNLAELNASTKKLPRLWAVGTDGNLYAGNNFGLWHRQVTWGKSVDVGVDEQGMPCVIAANGNAWQLDISTGKWLNAKGELKAIAAGPDRSMWLVGQDGKLYNRGGRKFGFWEFGGRSRPAPGETWCEYEAERDEKTSTGQPVQDFIQKGELAPLVREAVNAFVDGGASVLRVGQSFAIDGKTLDQPLEWGNLIIAAVLGIDVFLLIDVIRTEKKVVPYPDPKDPTDVTPDYRALPFKDQ